MKRITVSLDDEIYASLVDYAADSCKQDLSRLSVSKAMRKLLASELGRLNYYPMTQKKQQELHVRQIIRQRAQQLEDPLSVSQDKAGV